MARPFLTAEWRDLVLVNYEIDPHRLHDCVPTGTELDLHEGACIISLVAFKFRETKVRGLAVPGHQNFIEVNLRFYVKRLVDGEVRRGVTFIKELVPRPLITFVARQFYGEPYETWDTEARYDSDRLTYEWSRRGCKNSLSVTTQRSLGLPGEGSRVQFIIEHYWGYTRRSSERTDEYQVTHAPWSLVSIEDATVEVDFAGTYGAEFAFLSAQRPESILMAEGGHISGLPGRRLQF